MEIYTLSALERSEVWTNLTPAQQGVFDTYTMDRVTSELLTSSFHISSRWRLVGVNIDYGWEMRKLTGHHYGYQYCACGRKLKYQYELEAVNNPRRHLFLGSTHFAEEAGIPTRIAVEIELKMNQIQIYMDEILYRYKRGERFREDRFGYLFDLDMMNEPTHFNVKMRAFRDANLPLFHVDEDRLFNVAARYPRPGIKTIMTAPGTRIWTPEEIQTVRTADDKALITLEQRHHESSVQQFVKGHEQRATRQFSKALSLAAHHTMTLIAKQPRAQDVAAQYWLDVAVAIHGKPEKSWRTMRIIPYEHSERAFIHDREVKPADFPITGKLILTLEAAVWHRALKNRTPSYEWQLVQLRRIIVYIRLSAAEEQSPNKAATATQQVLNALTKRPEAYNSAVAVQINNIYKATLLTPTVRNCGEVKSAAYQYLNQVLHIIKKPTNVDFYANGNYR